MAINPDFLGKTFPPGPAYEISRVKLAEFADAIGDPNPVYCDRSAAVEAGFPDVIAPPTFPFVISIASSARALADPGLNLNYAMVVISDIREVGRNSTMTTTTQISTVDGEHVCTTYSTLVERGGAQ